MAKIEVSGRRNARHLLKALGDCVNSPVRTEWKYDDEQVDEKAVVCEHADPCAGPERAVDRRIGGKTVD